MIRSLPAICLLVIAVELTGQVSLQIGIYDNKNRPLEHMHIRVGSISKASDQMGIAVFELPGEGRYYVRIEGIGYQNSEDSIDVVDGSMLSLMLDPETYQLPGIELIGAWIKPDQPFTYGSISGHELERDNLGLDVPYLLKSLPSTVVSSDAGTGIGYTGLRIRGSDPSRINVTIDGIPLNDSESQGVFWVDLPDFAGSSESIQVQRGVGTSTHGAGAFGGTINLMTSTLEREPFGEVQATLGSFGTRKGTIKFGSGLLFDRFSLDGRISTIQSDGYIDRASADLNSYFFSGKIIDDNQSIRINLFSGKEITYQAWNGVPAQYVDSNPTYNGAGIRSDGSFHDDQVDNYRQTHVHAHYNRTLTENLYAKVSLHYTKGKGFFELYQLGRELKNYGLEGDNTDLVERRWLDNDFYGAIFSLHSSPSSKSYSWTIGGGYNTYIGDHFGEIVWIEGKAASLVPTPLEYYRNDARKSDVNIYMQYEHELSQGFRAFADLQWRSVSYRFLGFNELLASADQRDRLHFFNPKAGIIYQQGNYTWYYSAAVAQREPNRSDYTGSSPGSRPRSEFLLDHELGLRASSTDWSWGINTFYMDYRNQLVLTGKLNDVGEYIRTNVMDSYRAGLELVGKTKIGRVLKISGNATLSSNKIKSFTEHVDNWDTGIQQQVHHKNSPITFSPGLLASGSISWQIYKGSLASWQIDLTHQFVGRQYLDNTGTEPSLLDRYHSTDLHLSFGYKLRWLESFRFNLLIRNLFDNHLITNGWIYRYQSAGYDARLDDPYARSEHGDRYNLTGYYPQAGISLLAGISVRF